MDGRPAPDGLPARRERLHLGKEPPLRFGFCPAFWDWIAREHEAGRVFSIEKVADELAAVQDDLSAWAVGIGDHFFLKPDTATLPALSSIASWVTDQPAYSAAAKSTFLQIADFYLVAQALAGRHVVVTHERPNNSIHVVKIPNACIGVGVSCVTPFEMLRRERARFVLAAGAGSRS